MKKVIAIFLFLFMSAPAWAEEPTLSIDDFLKMSDSEQSIFLSGFMFGGCHAGRHTHSYIWSFGGDNLKKRDINPAFNHYIAPMCAAFESSEEISFAKYVLKWAQGQPYYCELSVDEILFDSSIMSFPEVPMKMRMELLDNLAQAIKKREQTPHIPTPPPPSDERR